MSTERAVVDQPTPDKRSLKTWWSLVKSAASAWIDDYAPSMGAALSYYTVFSLAPLLLIVVSVAGLVFGEEAVRGELFAQLQGLMGEDAAKAIEGLLASVSQPRQGRRRHGRRPGRPPDRRDDRVRRAAGRARPHLARAGAREGRPLVAAARAPAVVRDDPRRSPSC